MNYGIFVSTRIKDAPLSFVSDVDMENGMLVEMGPVVDGAAKYQVYTALPPSGEKPVYVVGDPAWSYDNSQVVNMNEDAFIIPAGTIFRVYPISSVSGNRPDRFEIADYSIDNSDDVAFGDVVGLTAGSFRPIIGGDTDAFEGKVVKVDKQGASFFVGKTVDNSVKLVTIEVIRNTEVTV